MLPALIIIACVVFGLISVSACMHDTVLKTEYPDYFSQIKTKSGKCADISGKYAFSALSLTDSLKMNEGVYNTIEIHSDDNSIEVILTFDDKEVRKLLPLKSSSLISHSVYSSGPKCIGDGIIVSSGPPGWSRETTTIVYPAVDGALLLWRGDFVWHGLIPIQLMDYYDKGYWLRYEPVD